MRPNLWQIFFYFDSTVLWAFDLFYNESFGCVWDVDVNFLVEPLGKELMFVAIGGVLILWV